MKGLKRLSAIFIGILICVFSAVIFTGCDKKDSTCKLYAFSTQGGYVLVDDSKDPVEFGDEGSKIFTYTKNAKVKLKAVAETGYVFEKWESTAKLDKSVDLNNDEIEFNIDSAEMVIKASFVIDGSIKYTVSWNDSDAYEIIPRGINLDNIVGNSVELGLRESFKFSINGKDGYDIRNVVVKYNGIKITATSGVYTIPEITKDIQITVDGAQAKIYKVSLDPNTPSFIDIVPEYGYAVNVQHSHDFKFTLDIRNDGFDVDNMNVHALRYKGDTNYDEEELIADSDDIYTIENITTDVKITISNITNYQYDILYTDSEAYEIHPLEGYDDFSVTHSNDFKFTLEISEGYKSTDLIVKANNTILECDGKGIYTIENITQTITLTIEGVEAAEYTISYSTNSEAYQIKPLEGFGDKVNYNGVFKFTIIINDGYDDSNLTVWANDDIIDPNEEGIYSIENIDSNIIINVVGLTNGDPSIEYSVFEFNMCFDNIQKDEIYINFYIPMNITFTMVKGNGDQSYNSKDNKEAFTYTLDEDGDGNIENDTKKCSPATLKKRIDDILTGTLLEGYVLDSFALDGAGSQKLIKFDDDCFSVYWDNFDNYFIDVYLILYNPTTKEYYSM